MTTLPLFVHSDIDDMTDLTPNALRVYMHLARRANKVGVAWPSYQTIGDHCFASVSENPITRRSMARKAIDELITAGLIEKENRQNDGGYTSNAYLLAGSVSIGIPMPIDTAMPQNNEPMPIDTAMPNGTKDTLIEDTPLEDTPDEEDTQARDPLTVAWRQAYGDTIPDHLTEPLGKLVSKRGMAAAIHGIKSGAKANSRNFRYIAECARNYVPPTPNSNYANGPSYQVDLPGVHLMTPTTINGHVSTPLPPPMAHDDPWAIAVAELTPGFATSSAARWLEGSILQENGELAGVPFYRVVLTVPGANAQWMTQQAEPAIRKKLSGLLGKRVAIEIVSEKEFA